MNEVNFLEIVDLGDNRVMICGDNFDFLVEKAKLFNCNKNPGSWGRGHRKEPWITTFEGLLGETHYGKTVDIQPELTPGAKPIDFVVDGKTIDVKTTNLIGKMLIKSVSEDGKPMKFKAERYVQVSIESIDYEKRQAITKLIGGIDRTLLEGLPDVSCIRAGSWKNKECEWSLLTL